MNYIFRNLSPDGINIVTENETIKDPKTVLKNALNVSTTHAKVSQNVNPMLIVFQSDLKVIGKSALDHQLSSKTELEKVLINLYL